MYYTVDNQVLDVDIHSFFHIDMWKNPFPKTRMWKTQILEEHYASGQACKTDTYTTKKGEN